MVWLLVDVGRHAARDGAVHGQVRLAELSGSSLDESGGVLPGVTVTATFVGRGTVRSVVTQASGVLPAGRARAGGLRDPRRARRVHARCLHELSDSPSATVCASIPSSRSRPSRRRSRVSGESPIVDTTKSTLSGKISQTQVEELPVNGRNWLNFASLAPGVKGDVGQAPAGGCRFRDASDRRSSWTAPARRPSRRSARRRRYRRTSSASSRCSPTGSMRSWVTPGSLIVNAVTKSGTDYFDGSAFYYYRDDSLNARGLLHGPAGALSEHPVRRDLRRSDQARQTQFFTSYERQAEPTTKSANTGFASLDEPG